MRSICFALIAPEITRWSVTKSLKHNLLLSVCFLPFYLTSDNFAFWLLSSSSPFTGKQLQVDLVTHLSHADHTSVVYPIWTLCWPTISYRHTHFLLLRHSPLVKPVTTTQLFLLSCQSQDVRDRSVWLADVWVRPVCVGDTMWAPALSDTESHGRNSQLTCDLILQESFTSLLSPQCKHVWCGGE